VILASRSAEKTRPVIEEIRKETGNGLVEFMEFRARGLPLHLLVNNAGYLDPTE